MGEVKDKRDKKISVFGLFDDEQKLGLAVDALKAAGYRNDDISALLPDRSNTKTFAHEKHTKAPEGAAAGATAGVLGGGTVGLLLGLGAIAIPGLGAFLAAGPIMGALAGAGVGGAVGTLTGALIGMGIPEYEAKRYESFINQGGALLSVHADDSDWARKARSILDGFGAHDIDSSKEADAKGPKPERHRDI
ncbi:MAG: general stress protein [Myxococcota bacterium]|nr:general stress protein [Myxococcota bacterium]